MIPVELKALAAQFSVHAQSVDSIGLAEEGLAIVTAFEASMPKNILDHNEGALQGHIDALKLLFNDAMNNQKLAVVASLQALRASVAHDFGATVFPPATADFKAQVAQILTPHFEDTLSKDSAFRKFVEQELVNVNSVTGTKAFFALLDQVQDALKQKEAGYAQEIGNLQDKDAVDALALYPKQGVLAATDVLIPKLEDAYRLALFETLTSAQQDVFKAHNSELYEQLTREFALKKESEAFKKQAQIFKKQFEDYLLKAYDVDFNTITTVEQAQELLQGDERSFGGVEKQLATYEGFMGLLRSSNNVELAFELYEKLTPLYKKLKGVEEVFKLLKSDKITDLITFKKKFKFYAENRLTYSETLFHENYQVERFFRGPVGYLRDQEESALGKIKSVVGVKDGANIANPDEILEEIKELQEKLSNKRPLTAKELASLQRTFASLESHFKPLKDAYTEYEVAVDTAIQLSPPGDVPLLFEIDSKSFDKEKWEKMSDKEKQESLNQGRPQALEFIARALSVPGSVYVPPSAFFDVPRETLQARLIATGKTTSTEEDHRYRELAIPLRNDLLWSIEFEKLQGRPVSISEEVKEEMKKWVVEAQGALDPEVAGKILDINSKLRVLKAELASKVAVK